uniref:Myosin-2 n=1 Tax=Anthurium amnicola TaxID=1678845 RepID=A0A1D1XUY6_9ARAE
MMNPLIILTKPFAFFKCCCLFGAQIFFFASATWLLLVKALIKLQLDFCWNVITSAFSISRLPIRVLTALQREKMLEMKLHEMQTLLENLVWENKELEERLNISFTDCRATEAFLVEMEQEQDNALAKIDLLENELQDLKDENLQLSEFQGKSLWDYQGHHDKGDGKVHEGIPLGTNYGVPLLPSGYDGSGVVLRDVLMHGDTWDDESKYKSIKQNPLGAGSTSAGAYQFPPQAALEGFFEDAALQQQRFLALSHSVFSAILSLLVGWIIWEAQDPCMPLVAALFIVVGMSLSSVVLFFSKIKNKPASNAVALLSFNLFILGTLSSPTLPQVARVLAPPVLRFGSRVLNSFGFPS